MANFFTIGEDGWSFVRSKSGERFVPFGSNYYDPNAGWPPHLWSDFDVTRSRTHLEQLSHLGANIVRFHLSYPAFYSQDHVLNESGVEKLQELLAICRELGIATLITGLVYYEGAPKWDTSDYFASQGVLESLCFFWQELAARLKDEETVFGYDLYNEPSLPWTSPLLETRWRHHLRTRFGNPGEMGSRLHLPHRPAGLDDIAVPKEGDSSQPALLVEYRMFQEQLGFEWIKAQAEAIRSADPNHLITVGCNPWTMPGTPAVDRGYGTCRGFNSHLLAPLLDFLSVHYYPIAFFTGRVGPDPISSPDGRRMAIRLCEGLCRLNHEGKPVLLEEFGWYGGGAPRWDGLLGDLPYKSEDDQATYGAELVEASRDWCSGWIYWSFGDTPASNDISQFSGLVDAGGRIKPWALLFRELSQTLKAEPPRRRVASRRTGVDIPQLYTSREYEQRLWLSYVQNGEVGSGPDFDIQVTGWEAGSWTNS